MSFRFLKNGVGVGLIRLLDRIIFAIIGFDSKAKQEWSHRAGHMYCKGIYRENMIISSCLEPPGIEPEYLVCSITYWTSTLFVHTIAMVPQESPMLYDDYSAKDTCLLAFCVRSFTFPQSYCIKQILIMSHDCPGVKGQIFYIFSEGGHVAYQIKRNKV